MSARLNAALGCAATAILAALVPGAPPAAQRASGREQDVVFTAYSPRASAVQIMGRLLSPLESGQIERTLQQSKQPLREQSIELAQLRHDLRERQPQRQR